jgi:hypothetical protein
MEEGRPTEIQCLKFEVVKATMLQAACHNQTFGCRAAYSTPGVFDLPTPSASLSPMTFISGGKGS